jgi:hypothetical protein
MAQGMSPGFRWLVLAVVALVSLYLVIQSTQNFQWSERLGNSHQTRSLLAVAFSICVCVFVCGSIAWRILRNRSGR